MRKAFVKPQFYLLRKERPHFQLHHREKSEPLRPLARLLIDFLTFRTIFLQRWNFACFIQPHHSAMLMGIFFKNLPSIPQFNIAKKMNGQIYFRRQKWIQLKSLTTSDFVCPYTCSFTSNLIWGLKQLITIIRNIFQTSRMGKKNIANQIFCHFVGCQL